MPGPKMEFLPPTWRRAAAIFGRAGPRSEQGRSRLPRARPREHVAEIPRRSLHKVAAGDSLENTPTARSWTAAAPTEATTMGTAAEPQVSGHAHAGNSPPCGSGTKDLPPCLPTYRLLAPACRFLHPSLPPHHRPRRASHRERGGSSDDRECDAGSYDGTRTRTRATAFYTNDITTTTRLPLYLPLLHHWPRRALHRERGGSPGDRGRDGPANGDGARARTSDYEWRKKTTRVDRAPTLWIIFEHSVVVVIATAGAEAKLLLGHEDQTSVFAASDNKMADRTTILLRRGTTRTNTWYT